MKLLLYFLTFAIGLYLFGLLYLYLFQEKIIFRNDLVPKEVELPPFVKRVFLKGIEVGVIDKGSEVTLFYFGGNATNALEALSFFKEFPYNVVTFNYPSYGKSQGKPSQKAIFSTAKMVFEHFKTRKNVLIGRSLGTGVASYLASEYPNSTQGVILITPYHSLLHLAKLNYPFYPESILEKLVRHPFPSHLYLKEYPNPIYLILAQNDDTTPPQTVEKLLEEIKATRVVTIPNTTHANILEKEETKQVIRKFIQQLL